MKCCCFRIWHGRMNGTVMAKSGNRSGVCLLFDDCNNFNWWRVKHKQLIWLIHLDLVGPSVILDKSPHRLESVRSTIQCLDETFPSPMIGWLSKCQSATNRPILLFIISNMTNIYNGYIPFQFNYRCPSMNARYQLNMYTYRHPTNHDLCACQFVRNFHIHS